MGKIPFFLSDDNAILDLEEDAILTFATFLPWVTQKHTKMHLHRHALHNSEVVGRNKIIPIQI